MIGQIILMWTIRIKLLTKTVTEVITVYQLFEMREGFSFFIIWGEKQQFCGDNIKIKEHFTTKDIDAMSSELWKIIFNCAIKNNQKHTNFLTEFSIFRPTIPPLEYNKGFKSAVRRVLFLKQRKDTKLLQAFKNQSLEGGSSTTSIGWLLWDNFGNI